MVLEGNIVTALQELNCFGGGVRLWCLMPLSTKFSYIVVVSFVGG
jgi:hypothetical protein